MAANNYGRIERHEDGQEEFDEGGSQSVYDRSDPKFDISTFIGGTTGGLLMVLNTFFLMAPWITLTYWTKNEDNYWESLEIVGYTSFLYFTSITPMCFFIFFMLIMKLRNGGNRLAVWSRLLTYHCMVWGVLNVISSTVMLTEASKVRCGMYRCNMLKYLSGGFGILVSISLFIEAYVHYRIYGKHVCCRHTPTKAEMYGYN